MGAVLPVVLLLVAELGLRASGEARAWLFLIAVGATGVPGLAAAVLAVAAGPAMDELALQLLKTVLPGGASSALVAHRSALILGLLFGLASLVQWAAMWTWGVRLKFIEDSGLRRPAVRRFVTFLVISALAGVLAIWTFWRRVGA